MCPRDNSTVSRKVFRETSVGTMRSLALGVFWPSEVFKRIVGEESPKKETKQYVHGDTTYKGIVRDSCHGNPTGTIMMVVSWDAKSQ